MRILQQSGCVRWRVRITGVVQGVGFRPFVYQQAVRFGLAGWVRNDAQGVTLEAEGRPEVLERFLRAIHTEHPVLARIASCVLEVVEPVGETAFRIQTSLDEPGRFTLVASDACVCEDCLRELYDPKDRRFRYPFINCTRCGPRYSIVEDIPYDRARTSMKRFPLCPACRAEYEDPTNRRFHAQPVACWECGPRVWLEGAAAAEGREAVQAAIALLREGKILAIKGLGGFHLACDATRREAVARLRAWKRRNGKPFALMVPSLREAERLCRLGAAERVLLLSRERPIVILPRRGGTPVAEAVSPRNNTLGIFLPYTPLHYLLLAPEGPGASSHPFLALVMTSGNRAEEPIVADNAQARERFSGIADAFLLHDRDIAMRVDDSVVRAMGSEITPIRRARGYAPEPIPLGEEVPEVLACGAELKNTLCLTQGRYAFLSQHLGDLENAEVLAFFQEVLEHFKRLFRVEPRAVAHDLHPRYLSTHFAQSLGLPRVGVQHHHAHVVSCMAEHGLRHPVIGVAWDGTGYGPDGTVWGGEVLVADPAGYRRMAHFRTVPMPGGEQAVREPYRMALSHLRDLFGTFRVPERLPAFFQRMASRPLDLLETALARGVNCPLTSSCGRLFDAVASLVGIQDAVSFEGEAAMMLETLVRGTEPGEYAFGLEGEDPWVVDTRPLIRGIVEDVQRHVAPSVIAERFHRTLARCLGVLCQEIRKATGLKDVVLSGGVFQNRVLLNLAREELTERRFRVYTHACVPPNDGGIALGQALVAAWKLKHGSLA